MIEIKNVVKSYKDGDGELIALNNLSLKIEKNEFVVILGPSGSGKSTLLNVLSGLEKADSGSINYYDKDIAKYNDRNLRKFRRDNIAFVFQSYYLLPTLTVEANVRMGADLSGTKDSDAINDIIKQVGLEHMEKRLPHQLSGGQQQRVSIARAIAKRPKVLFCDEPTGALDEKTSQQILSLFEKIRNETGLTVIMVTHNNSIAQIATRVIKMNSGNIVENIVNECPEAVSDLRWN